MSLLATIRWSCRSAAASKRHGCRRPGRRRFRGVLRCLGVLGEHRGSGHGLCDGLGRDAAVDGRRRTDVPLRACLARPIFGSARCQTLSGTWQRCCRSHFSAEATLCDTGSHDRHAAGGLGPHDLPALTSPSAPASGRARPGDPRPFRVLHLEDCGTRPRAGDGSIAVSAAGCVCARAGSHRHAPTNSCARARTSPGIWCIVSDYHLPGFSPAWTRLQMLREHTAAGAASVPFILVSGRDR